MDKAITAGIMAILSVLTLSGRVPWLGSVVTDEWVAGVIALLTPLVVYFVPNKTDPSAASQDLLQQVQAMPDAKLNDFLKELGKARNILALLIGLSLAAALAACATLPTAATPQRATSLSFCRVYHRVILTEADGASLASADQAVRERIATNDATYRCTCEGWDHPVCHGRNP
jgi:hypothetical protein